MSKIDAARITKLDVEMFYDGSWKIVYFGSVDNGGGHQFINRCRRGSLHSCEC